MKIKKKILLIIMIALNIVILKSNQSYATLKSNGETAAKYQIGDMIKAIRQMETLGGTLGLNETINGTTLVSTSQSNNLDCHMEKNSEYGAMAILSASSYGNQNKISNGETTTGNKSGIYINIGGERVLAGAIDKTLSVGDRIPIFKTMASRYRNTYSSTGYKRNVGDAMSETFGWHGAINDPLELRVPYDACVVRAYSGSLFSINAYTTGSGNYYAGCYVKYPSRAVIVVGEGF